MFMVTVYTQNKENGAKQCYDLLCCFNEYVLPTQELTLEKGMGGWLIVIIN